MLKTHSSLTPVIGNYSLTEFVLSKCKAIPYTKPFLTMTGQNEKKFAYLNVSVDSNNVFKSNESWSFKNFSGQGKQSVLMTVRQCKFYC